MSSCVKAKIDSMDGVFERHLDLRVRDAYSMYMFTKKLAYKRIAKNFIGSNVLELGSDESPTSSILVRWSKKLTVVDMYDKFTKKIEFDSELLKAKFVLSKWEDFLPDELFSDIVLTDSLEHVENPIQILKLCYNWLQTRGRLHIVVPNALSIHRLIGVEMGCLKTPYDFNENDIGSGHLRVYDMDSLERDVMAAGFFIEDMSGIQFKPMSDTQLCKFSDEYIASLERIGDLFPKNCAQIYACCTR